eukprot:TRINITY_DN40548_c0_g1_i1.p1 TRINITY_DN40548_c0_g1~~TRINITY_DN40548_c0_g1_i1.p1  ORF type:complete len:279 (-),score=41.95 TRINITY_DN40548_c0_g1_i1:352-1188(-)
MDGTNKLSTSDFLKKLLREDETNTDVDELLQQYQEERSLKLNLNSHMVSKPRNFDLPTQFQSFDSAVLDEDLARRYAQLKASASSKSRPSANLEAVGCSKSGDSKAPEESRSDQEPDCTSSDSIRFAKQEVVSKGMAQDDEEVKILGSDLAARFAALRANSKGKSDSRQNVDLDRVLCSTEMDSTGSMIGRPDEGLSEEQEVRALLASAEDAVRLDRARVSRFSAGSLDREKKSDDETDENEGISESEVEGIVEWAKDAARLENDETESESETDSGVR